MDKIEFYDLKTRSKVSVDAGQVTRRTFTRATKNGEQTRYGFEGKLPDGRKLTKFVNKATYDAFAA